VCEGSDPIVKRVVNPAAPLIDAAPVQVWSSLRVLM
jgi:hypothetical protein